MLPNCEVSVALIHSRAAESLRTVLAVDPAKGRGCLIVKSPVNIDLRALFGVNGFHAWTPNLGIIADRCL